MKFSLFICVSLILIFSSCSKKTSDLIPFGGGTVTMKVNGVSWTGTTMNGNTSNDDAVYTNNKLEK